MTLTCSHGGGDCIFLNIGAETGESCSGCFLPPTTMPVPAPTAVAFPAPTAVPIPTPTAAPVPAPTLVPSTRDCDDTTYSADIKCHYYHCIGGSLYFGTECEAETCGGCSDSDYGSTVQGVCQVDSDNNGGHMVDCGEQQIGVVGDQAFIYFYSDANCTALTSSHEKYCTYDEQPYGQCDLTACPGVTPPPTTSPEPSPSPTTSCECPDDALCFEECSVTDTGSGSGQMNATLYGNATCISSNEGGALGVQFDGVASYAALVSAEFGGDEFSIAVWVKLDVLSYYARIFELSDDSNSNFILLSLYGGSGRLTFGFNLDGSKQWFTGGTATIEPGEWAHLVLVVNFSKYELYQDGSLILSEAGRTIPASTYSLNYLGRPIHAASWSQPHTYLQGAIFSFQYYASCLSAASVATLYIDDPFCPSPRTWTVTAEPSPTPSTTIPLPVPTNDPSPMPSTAIPLPVPTKDPSPMPSIAAPLPVPTKDPSPAPVNNDELVPTSSPSASPPVVDILKPEVAIVDPASKVHFVADVFSNSLDAVTIQWYSGDIDPSDPLKFSTPSNTPWLVARRGVFVQGHAYTFVVVATDVYGHRGINNITITANRPPSSGTFTVHPQSGIALETVFHLSSTGWEDSQGGGLLTYAFSYSSGTAASGITVYSGRAWNATTFLPLGSNLTLRVIVSDGIGSSTEVAPATTIVNASKGAVISVVNQIAEIEEMVQSRRGEDAMALIAMCANTLNAAAGLGSESTATATRHTLLALAINNTLNRDTNLTAGTIDLNAATLEILSATPSQLTPGMQTAMVSLALEIANSSRVIGLPSIPDTARMALVATLSSVIEAGSFEASSSTIDPILNVLEQIHLLTLASLAPGEEQLETRAASCALGSLKAACFAGSCPPTVIPSPLLSDEQESTASFVLSRKTVAEILAGTRSCEEGDDAAASDQTLGLQSIRWKSNPWTTDLATSNQTVESLSITSCDREYIVQNLTNPVEITLPVTFPGDIAEDTSPQVHRGVCKSKSELVVVHCNETARDVTISCPGAKATWELACPQARLTAQCRFWDGTQWSTDGLIVSNFSAETVQCFSSHLSAYVAVVSKSTSGVVRVFGLYGELDVQAIKKTAGFLALLVGCYIFSVLVGLNDLHKLRDKKMIRLAHLLDSEAFAKSIRAIEKRSTMASGFDKEALKRRATSIEKMSNTAIQHVDDATHVTLKSAWVHYRHALAEEHKLLALFGTVEASFQRAPIFLMELLTFLVGCAFLHIVNDGTELSSVADYDGWAEAFETSFSAVCLQFKVSLADSLKDTICLAIAVMPVRYLTSAAIDSIESKRWYDQTLDEKCLTEGVPLVTKASSSQVDIRRAIHRADAARRAIVRLSKNAPAEQFSATGYLGSAETFLFALTEYIAELKQTVATEFDAQSKLNEESLTTHNNSLVTLGAMKSEFIHDYVQEQRLIAAFPRRWQRVLYACVLTEHKIPKVPLGAFDGDTKRTNSIPAMACCGILYCLVATSFVFAFHLRQETQADVKANQSGGDSPSFLSF